MTARIQPKKLKKNIMCNKNNIQYMNFPESSKHFQRPSFEDRTKLSR